MIVYHTLLDTASRPLQHQTVKVSLVAPGNPFLDSGSGQAVIQKATVDTGTTGRFELDLIPNDSYDADGTYYLVDARDGLANPDAVWAIRVPSTGGPYDLRELVFPTPDPGQPIPPVQAHALGDHTDVDTTGEFAGQVLKFDGAMWRPGVDGGGGGGGGSFVHFQDIAAQVTTVNHQLGMRPAGVRLFAPDWLREYDEFAVEHLSDSSLTVTTEALFRGYVTVS